MERRLNYNYAQIDLLNTVIAVSSLWEKVPESDTMYNYMIPIRYYDDSLLGQRYIGLDADGYGLFESVEQEQNEAEQTKADQTETEQSESVTE